jgi:hypothetical protein
MMVAAVTVKIDCGGDLVAVAPPELLFPPASQDPLQRGQSTFTSPSSAKAAPLTVIW